MFAMIIMSTIGTALKNTGLEEISVTKSCVIVPWNFASVYYERQTIKNREEREGIRGGTLHGNHISKELIPTVYEVRSVTKSRVCVQLFITYAISYVSNGGAKRHRKVFENSMQGITKQAICRLACRAVVMLISGLAYEEIREVVKVFVNKVIRNAMIYCVQRGERP
uniref:Histone H4 n=1 Tax=Angiostrongylus cantonensis TaxID=6313 RepID=A0A0K0D2R0_ANGCA